MNDEILYATNKSINRRIDHLLRLMAIIFANCGKDSTNEELLIAYQKESAYMDEIKKLDANFEKRIRPYGRSEH